MIEVLVGVLSALVAAMAVYALMAVKAAAARAGQQAQEQRLAEQERHYQLVLQESEARFRDLAQRILDERSAKLKAEGTEGLRQTLDPLKTQLAQFRDAVRQANDDAIRRHANLEGTIKALLDRTLDVGKEAERLARAIESDAQVTGAWGEAQLKRVLELGGLEESVHYDLQETFASPGSDRRDLRTDALVKLPDDRWLVIDAKTTMAAYVDYAGADAADTEARTVARERIVASVKAHVDELKNAAYHRHLAAVTGRKILGTMLMYIPFDEVFLIAMKSEVTVAGERLPLREYARRHDIVFVNSSSLMPVIRLIEMLWARDKADRKAIRIKEAAEALIEKFNVFLSAADGFTAIGRHLNDAARCYNASLGRLAAGPGNMIKRLADLKEMGVSAAAKLPGAEDVAAHPADQPLKGLEQTSR